MANLSVNYMGLELKNPIIVGASTLTADGEMASRMEEAGAAAIVFKSLFEEQIQMESAIMADELQEYCDRNAEMTTIFPSLEHAGPKEHLLQLKQVKDSVSIPVIASLNCLYDVSWYDYAQQLEQVGVDALELNFYHLPTTNERSAAEIENGKVMILENLRQRIAIPISVKLSPYYTNLIHFIHRLNQAGADAFVLFNRLFQPMISTTKEKHVPRFNLSNPGDYRIALRFIGLLYHNIGANLCGSNGVYSAKDVIQMLLSGAQVVQMVSAIYKNKPGHIGIVLGDLEHWMDQKGYETIAHIRGKLSDWEMKNSDTYHRAQYLDYVLKPTEIMNKYPMR